VLLVEVMVALAVSMLLTAVLAASLPARRLWRGWLIFFGLVLLAAWAGGVWLPPVGPSFLGVYWMPFLFIGLVIALLFAPMVRRGASAQERADRGRGPEALATVLSMLVWILMTGLAVVILLAYI